MYFNVVVYEEGNSKPVKDYKLLVREQKKTILGKYRKKLKTFFELLMQSVQPGHDSSRLYLALTFSLLVLSIFNPQTTLTSILPVLLSSILAVLFYIHPYSQDKKQLLFFISYILIFLGHYNSQVFPASASYIFPMVSIYKSQLKPGQGINILHMGILLIPELVLSHNFESIFFLTTTLYAYLSNHSVQILSTRSSRNSNLVESPRSSKLLYSENPLAPYSNVIQSINYSISLLKKSESRESIEESTESLQRALKIMQKNQNIYSPTLKKITKHMDIEDKIFLEQTTLASSFEVTCHSPVKLATPDLKYGVDELAGILKQIGREWNFNTFFVANCTANEALYTCGEYVFGYYYFIKTFNIGRDVLRNFLKTVENKYNMNPYHNSCHAADVMNSFLFLCSSVVSSIPSVELFASVLACLGHDIGHPGTNNRFLVQTKHELALFYNDISVLENMHAKEMFTIMSQDSCNIISQVGDYWVVRKVIIELILSTDMAKHFEFVSACKSNDKSIKQKLENFTERLELYKLCIKAADISHTAKSTELHERWCKLLMEEFFSQGDKEKELNLAVSMYCDRNKTDVQKSQAGFLKNIALPLFITLHQYVQSDELERECLQQLRRNIQFWEKRKDNGRNSMASLSIFEYFRPENRRTTLPKRLI